MDEKLAFDWEALTTFVDSVTARHIPGSPESSRFTRLQEFIHEHSRVDEPDKSRDAMIVLAQEFQLGWFPAARLFVKLQQLGSAHRFDRQLESVERAGDFVKSLESVRGSLYRLAAFSQSLLDENKRPRERITETHLEWAAHFWADGVRRESEKSGQSERWDEAVAHGFNYKAERIEQGSRISRRGDGEYHTFTIPANYDPLSVVRTWLRNNVLFSELVAGIIDKKRAPTQSDEGPSETEASAIVELVGNRLPVLYEKAIGEHFGFSRVFDLDVGYSVLRDVTGVRFVGLALDVIGVERLTPQTIEDYRKQYLKRRKIADGE